jgi:mannitol/fructose-specific phosphotransferase system IIA component (Ntr-type)
LSFRRFLRPEAIRLELKTSATPAGELPEGFDPLERRNLDRVRDEVLEELCELFEATGEVASRARLFRDLQNREKKAGTAIGGGLALPHVRTLQAREFVMCFARSKKGLPFRAPDDEPVRIFIGMVAPPYDDRTYLKVYKSLAPILQDPDRVQGFLEAGDPSEILRILEILR